MKTVKEYLITELCAQHAAVNAGKDIIVVIHDQLEFVTKCINALFTHTKQPFHLYLWDNASKDETRDYLRFVAENENVTLVRSEENEGFIPPNNKLAATGMNDYLILLNSDTEVSEGWDSALLGYLQSFPDVALVGYQGGILSKEGMGVNVHTGDEIDFVQGWCMCLSRKTYEQFGLFDEVNLQFAYGEDCDLCLRLKEAGKKVYALNLYKVVHHANKTTMAVKNEMDMTPSFVNNHRYLKERWSDFLSKNRVLLGYPEIENSLNQQWKEQHGSDLSVESLVDVALRG